MKNLLVGNVSKVQKKIKLPVILAFAAVIASGCSTVSNSRKQKTTLMTHYQNGNYANAKTVLNKYVKDRANTGDELMWLLEEGSFKYEHKNFKGSIIALDKAENIIKEFDRRATINLRGASSGAGSAITNPNAIKYSGFNYDRILLNTYKALNYFAMGNSEAAGVELRKAYERQKDAKKRFDTYIKVAKKEIEAAKKNSNGKSLEYSELVKNAVVKNSIANLEAKANTEYKNFVNPLVTYLSSIVYLTNSEYNEAYVNLIDLYRMDPSNKLIQKDLVTTAINAGMEIPEALKDIKPYDYPLNKNIVYVIYAHGLAPALKEKKVQFVFPIVGYTGIAYPDLEYFKTHHQALQITDNYGKEFKSYPVADMDAIVAQEYKELLPMKITKIVAGALTKEIASFIAVQAAQQAGGTLGYLGAMAATSAYKYAFNTADTRCWQMLPKEFIVSHLPMPKDGIIKINADFDNEQSKTEEIKLNTEKKVTVIFIRSQSQKALTIITGQFS